VTSGSWKLPFIPLPRFQCPLAHAHGFLLFSKGLFAHKSQLSLENQLGRALLSRSLKLEERERQRTPGGKARDRAAIKLEQAQCWGTGEGPSFEQKEDGDPFCVTVQASQ
jgi:hypothetical protein